MTVAQRKPATAAVPSTAKPGTASGDAKFGRRATPSGPPPTGDAAKLAKLKALQAAKSGKPGTASGYTPSTGAGARPAPVRPGSRAGSSAGPRPPSTAGKPSTAASKPPPTGAKPGAKPPPSRADALKALANKKKPGTAAGKPPATGAKPPATARPSSKAGAKRPTTAAEAIDNIPVAKAKSFSAVPPELEAAEPAPLVVCKSCKRSFTKEALAKHAKVCTKVFVQKRKPMDVQAQRVQGTDAAKYVKGSTAKGGKKPAAKAAPKKAKWKQESAQLRQAMASARAVTAAQKAGKDLRTVDIPQLAEEDDDRVPCPHCGRKFSQQAADRHIPQCQNIKAKPSVLKAGAKTGKAPASRGKR
mmetsp:Transcript_14948/g.31186  ORF Transcript_14948/g.31186 Transcript_14948/m.31186 type:complete len:359 (+) Transcript_14948:162-1238(+)